MIKCKRFCSLILSILFVVTLATSNVQAQTGPPPDPHAGCIKQNHKVYYSLKKCKEIVKTTKKIQKCLSYGQVLASAAGKKGIAAGVLAQLVVVKFNDNIGNTKNFFNKAVKKKKGVLYTYTYHISNISYSCNHGTKPKMVYK